MATVASVDVGSNAVRLLIVELSEAGRVLGSEHQRWPLRLGADTFSGGAVTDARANALVAIFHDIRERMARRGVERYRAVATAALREAQNAAEVVARIEREAGMRLELIDGSEEGRLSRDALLRAVGWAPADTLLIDLGGGSLELERAGGAGGASLPLGTVRLLQGYPRLEGPLDEQELEDIVARLDTDLGRLTRSAPLRRGAAMMIGTGGNLSFLAQAAPQRGSTMPAIDVRRLPALAAQLAALSVEERMQQYALRRDRAEIILAGVAVVLALVRRFKVRSFVVPGTGLRESVLFELTEPPPIEPRARALLERLGQDTRRPERRARLAAQLFAITGSVHRLWRPALVPLTFAAYLLEVGRAIDAQDPAPHTAYVIENAEGLDLEPRQRRIAALAARLALGDTSSGEDLGRHDREVAERCAALLLLAESLLDRGGTTVTRADTLSSPLRIESDAVGRMPRGVMARVERHLGSRLRVR